MTTETTTEMIVFFRYLIQGQPTDARETVVLLEEGYSTEQDIPTILTMPYGEKPEHVEVYLSLPLEGLSQETLDVARATVKTLHGLKTGAQKPKPVFEVGVRITE